MDSRTLVQGSCYEELTAEPNRRLESTGREGSALIGMIAKNSCVYILHEIQDGNRFILFNTGEVTFLFFLVFFLIFFYLCPRLEDAILIDKFKSVPVSLNKNYYVSAYDL